VRHAARLRLDAGNGPSGGTTQEGLRADPEVATLLSAQRPDGGWAGPSFYAPKHRSTLHTLAVLAELGVDRSFPEIERAADFAFAFQAANGEFYQHRRVEGGRPSTLAPVPCVTARAAAYLAGLGYGGDARVAKAIQYLLSIQRQDGSWSCGDKAMPRGYVSEKGCLGMTCCFLALADTAPALSRGHPATRSAALFAERLYLRDPRGFHVGNTWAVLPHPSFPMDLADTGRHLVTIVGLTPRVSEGVELCLQKRRSDGLWAADGHPYRPPLPPDRRGEPSAWVTLRVARFLKAARRAGRGKPPDAG